MNDIATDIERIADGLQDTSAPCLGHEAEWETLLRDLFTIADKIRGCPPGDASVFRHPKGGSKSAQGHPEPVVIE